MAGNWPKIIRDPVHNIIEFGKNDTDILLLKLINTREFQRLRRIQQLGVSNFVYPGATHTRFSHSIGTMHIARQFLERLKLVTDQGEINEDVERIVLTAALLHDVGHGPFSHAFEKVSGIDHEHWTEQIITDEGTEINGVLSEIPNLVDNVIKYFNIDPFHPPDQPPVPLYTVGIVSSQMDADRFDYLLRDCHFTGTKYGQFDMDWLIRNLEISENRTSLVVGPKGIDAAEEYVFARYHAYRSVYFHKTTRSVEVMIQFLINQIKAQLKIGKPINEIVPYLPIEIIPLLEENLLLGDLLRLDDHSAWGLIKACCNSPDEQINKTASGLVNRELLKGISVHSDKFTLIDDLSNEVSKVFNDNGMDPALSWLKDTPADKPYFLYDPDKHKNKTPIYVRPYAGEQIELSEARHTIRELTSKYQLIRYYYPGHSADIRKRVIDICNKVLYNS